MAVKINGISGTFPVPNVNKMKYRFTKFDATLKANVNGIERTVTVKTVLDSVWNAVVKRSMQTTCNDSFKTLLRKKTLAEILAEGDLVLHCLEPKPGFDYDALPDADTAGRDIGIDPTGLFAADVEALACTLIHELAHVGGASTNPSDPPEQAHAAEKTLLSCSCKKHYRENVLGTIKLLRPLREAGRRYV